MGQEDATPGPGGPGSWSHWMASVSLGLCSHLTT